MRKLLLLLPLLLALGCHGVHTAKHTGPVTVQLYKSSKCIWFSRPNNELFEMCFDNPPPFAISSRWADIVYTDDNADLRHFIGATMVKQ